MLILAIDTSFGASSAAIGEFADGHLSCLAEAARDAGPGQAEALLPLIEGLASKVCVVPGRQGFSLGRIERIAVTLGPGTFTGVRTGIATARGLALALGVPTVGASSLATIAGAARRSAGPALLDRVLVVAMPAGRGWLYVETFAPGGLSSHGPQAILEQDAALCVPAQGAVLAGTASPLLAAAARATGRSIHAAFDTLHPSAGELLALTPQLNPDLLPVAPLYLRPPDAKPQTDSSLPRASE